jgi:hypothetical protein
LPKVKRVQAENEKRKAAFPKLKVERQAVKDELARLKGLPPPLRIAFPHR